MQDDRFSTRYFVAVRSFASRIDEPFTDALCNLNKRLNLDVNIAALLVSQPYRVFFRLMPPSELHVFVLWILQRMIAAYVEEKRNNCFFCNSGRVRST